MNYICEAESNCKRVQSAICLHCHRRLCLEHLTEHNNLSLNTLSNLSNEIQLTLEQINNESVKRRELCDENLKSVNEWHDEQKQQLEQTHERLLKSNRFQREIFTYEESKLFYQLEHDAFIPLKELQDQGVVNVELINQIQHVIDSVREANSSLQQKIAIPKPPSGNIFANNQLPTNSDSSTVVNDQTPTNTDLNTVVNNQSQKNSRSNTVVNKRKRKKSNSNITEKQSDGVLYKRLVSMFSNLQSIDKNKQSLHRYIRVRLEIV